MSTPTDRLYAQKPSSPPSTGYQRKIPLLRQYRKTAPSIPQSRKYRMSSKNCIACAGMPLRRRLPHVSPSSVSVTAALLLIGRHRTRRRRAVRLLSPTALCRSPNAAAAARKISYNTPRRIPKMTASGIVRHSPAALASTKTACSVAMSYAPAVIAANVPESRPRMLCCRPYNTAPVSCRLKPARPIPAQAV